MNPSENPFAFLSLIAAPAVLTNACSVLILSTSNRVARAVDRARELTAQLEQAQAGEDPMEALNVRELQAAEERSLMLLRALRLFYGALGGFACAAFVSLIGAFLAASGPRLVVFLIEMIAVLAGCIAVGGLLSGSVLLVRETRIAVDFLHEQTVYTQSSLKQRLTAAQEANRTPQEGKV
ncbi:MAG TPA: DUF2721 domain-containing protein [Chthonomonadaceae bacterium]|nr:DUF2721 domain-containing protein [Chthonomonadaceae bacterium]